jgi:hypothetical protein
MLMTEKEDDWRKPFIDFILDQLVPDDKTERERITRRSANYIVIGSDLYRKAASTGILMKCNLRSENLQLLAEIHSGECGFHAASTNLVGKAYRFGFYWPMVVTDAKDLVKRCKGCQFFAKQQHYPPILALRYMGSRRGRTVSYRSRQLQTYPSCCRQIQ